MASIYDSAVETARRTMTLFFVVDTSGSMEGEKIGILNSAIEDVLPEVKKISAENADAQIKIAVLEFSDGAFWITPQPVDCNDFEWNYLSAAGFTSFGEMCSKLNEKLSRNEFMNDVMGSFAPAIFLISDGEPTDNYKESLNTLRQNNWFKKAVKAAVAIGDDANLAVLAEFTGSQESVITVCTPETMRNAIRFVSITASQIGSRSSNISTAPNPDGDTPVYGNKQADFVKALSAADISNVDDEGLDW